MSIIEFLMGLLADKRLKSSFSVRLMVRPFLNSFLRAPSDSLMYAEVAIAPPRVLSAGYPGPIPFLRGVMNLPLKNFPSSTACGCNQSLSSTSACQNSLFFSPFFCHRQQLQKHERYARLSSTALPSELVDPTSISSFFERESRNISKENSSRVFSKSLFLPEFELLEDQ